MGGTRIANVRKSFGAVEVIRDVSLDNPDGSFPVFFSLRSPSSRPWQVDARMISGGEVGGIVPLLARPTRGRLGTPLDGQAELRFVALAYARRAPRWPRGAASWPWRRRASGGRAPSGPVIVAASVSSTAMLTINK